MVVRTTFTHRCLPDGGTDNSERVHHRLVLKEICRPLEYYRNSGELITITHLALLGRAVFTGFVHWLTSCLYLAHAGAWELAGIMHRDVSIGNIMIDVEAASRGKWYGYLTDWDLCKYKEDMDKQVRSLPGRSVSLCPVSECKGPDVGRSSRAPGLSYPA